MATKSGLTWRATACLNRPRHKASRMPINQNLGVFMRNITGIDPEGLARRPELGEINFEAALGALQQMKAFFEEALLLDWGAVPSQVVDSIRTEVQALWMQVSQMINFRVANRSSPEQERNAIQTNVLKLWGKCYAYTAPHVAYLKSKSPAPDLQAVVANLKGQTDSVVTQVRAQADAISENLVKLNKEAEDERQRVGAVLKTVTDAAKDVGVTQEAAEFSKLARNYFWGAVGWLAAALVLGIVTFVYAGLILHDLSPLPSNQFAAVTSAHSPATSNNGPLARDALPSQLKEGDASSGLFAFLRTLVPRLIRVTLLLTLFVFCLKNYSALSHNYIVNRHRATALSTFQTFVTGGRDEQIKSAILLQASQAIFSPQPSAFLKGDSDSPQITPVYEIAKTLVSKGKD